ncbi:MAG TPA: hemin uptake protein HemP [Paracoccaceae bacterium]|nr:hemin uptake protein HemP [Paracoccaceae bacterium]
MMRLDLRAQSEREVRLNEPPVHDARDLAGGGREARIVLDGVAYTLRITRQGKLILTK